MLPVFNTSGFHGTVTIQMNLAMVTRLGDFIDEVSCDRGEDKQVLALRSSLRSGERSANGERN